MRITVKDLLSKVWPNLLNYLGLFLIMFYYGLYRSEKMIRGDVTHIF
jgi:hypothetical protein